MAVILEGAFLDNDKDVPAIDTLTGRKAFGTAYAKGILAYAGITWIEEKPALPDWQMEGLKVLQAAKIIEDPEYWVPRMAKNITVGEVVGLLGKVITGG